MAGGESMLEPLMPAWERILPGQFERLVSMLLTRLEPDGHPVDGAGGDGGVDYLVRTAAGERIYQAKGFTGRLTPARRKQIQRSLDAVAGRRIEDWSLLVPINPTPGESAWLATELARRGIVGRLKRPGIRGGSSP